jgi:hypothetical protein
LRKRDEWSLGGYLIILKDSTLALLQLNVTKDSGESLKKLYGPIGNPFYIYAPRWIDSSAGIKALHLLCHALNQIGEMAFLVICEESHKNRPRVNGLLKTPVLTQEIADAHYKARLTPITVYSETIPGNPIGAPFVVRFIGNYLGALGGPKAFAKDDFIVAYSETLSKHAAKKLDREDVFTLFFHAIDPRPFKDKIEKEDFLLLYAAKYRIFQGEPDFKSDSKVIEILRDGPLAQSRGEVLHLLRRATGLVTYENSAIAMEAILSGTPAILIKNEFFSEGIADVETKGLGYRWGFSAENLAEAKSELETARQVYLQTVEDFFPKLVDFASLVQIASQKKVYKKAVTVPNYHHTINHHRIRMAIMILKNQGVIQLIRVIKAFIARRTFSPDKVQNL